MFSRKGGELLSDKVMLKIKKYRQQAGLTQSQLAALVGATQKQISAWENGTNEPSIRVLKAISKTLSCAIDDLVD